METQTFKRVHCKEAGITTGIKKYTLALVNENKPEYLGRWMKVNRIRLMVEPLGSDQYKVSAKHHHAYGLLGAYDSISEYFVKLS